MPNGSDTAVPGETQELVNFGGNVRWRSRVARPTSEEAVLALLTASTGRTIRVLSSRHSWSDIAANADIALDLGAFDKVEPTNVNGRDLVRVGAGCVIQKLLDELHEKTGRTLPTIGVIKKQTVAGAISTGTHGSGRQSLSHFVAAVRIAVSDAAGTWTIRDVSSGPELLAVRCGLGCAGVLLQVDFETVPKYAVAETIRRHQTVGDILQLLEPHPLTAFALWPHEGYLLVQQRRIAEKPPSGVVAWLKARFFRIFGLVAVDLAFALLVLASVRIGKPAIKFVQWFGPRALIKNAERIDDAEHVLTMRQDIFRHEEMEIFVRQRDLAQALAFAQAAVRYFAGDSNELLHTFKQAIDKSGEGPALARQEGTYVLPYPIYCRRVLPEDTLMSMAASADEPWFSISFFSYEAAEKRAPYYALCLFVAKTLRQLVNVRLHWGKHAALQYPETTENHPRFEDFRAICIANDPNGVLRNDFTARVLNMPPGGPSR